MKALALCVFLVLPCTLFGAEPVTALELEMSGYCMVFVDQSILAIEITNVSDHDIEVPTGTPTMIGGFLKVDGKPVKTSVSAKYDILTIGANGGRRKVYIPSIVDLKPVKLRSGETARFDYALQGTQRRDLLESEIKQLEFEYIVSNSVAERFSLWRGTLRSRLEVVDHREQRPPNK